MAVDGFVRRVSAAICVALRCAAVGVGLFFPVLWQPTPGFAEAAYAFGQGQFGTWTAAYGYNHTTQTEAQSAAMQKCMGRGIPCSIIASFHKTCFAIAVQDGNNGWAVRYGPDLASASRSALKGCVAMGISCSIKDRFCDSVSEQEVQQAALDQASRELEAYQRAWQECFAATPGETDVAAAMGSCSRALTFSQASPSDRNWLTRQGGVLQTRIAQMRDDARRAELKRRQDEADARLFDEYHAREDACGRFDELSCTLALRSPVPNDDARARLRVALSTIQRLKNDIAACKDGSTTACDMALASPAARDDDRIYLQLWRQAASPVDKGLAMIRVYWMAAWDGIQSMSVATLIAVAVPALVVLLTVRALLASGRSHPRPDVLLTDEAPSDQPPPRCETQMVTAQLDIFMPETTAQEPLGFNLKGPETPALDIGSADIAARHPTAPPKLDKAAIKRALLARRQEFEL